MSRVSLAAPIAGWLTSVRVVPDPVFSEEMMGEGLAIDPTEGALVAPCAAQVLMVAPTHHSVTLQTDEGAELLIHVGLDTVALGGRGFEAHVHDGDRVAAGDRLISFDLDLVGLEAKSLVTPIVLTNSDEFKLAVDGFDRLVERGWPVASIIRRAEAKAKDSQGEQVHSSEAVIGFAHGLHARPAARIADCAKGYSTDLTIRIGAKEAKARSPVAIMALNAKKGDRLALTATGDQGPSALEAIVRLIEGGEDPERSVPTPIASRPRGENEIAGVCALPGIALGTAIHWQRELAEAPEQGAGIETERAILEQARSTVRARLHALSANMSGAAAAIARAHVSLLEDEALNAAAFAEIDRGLSAARAWQLATSSAAEALHETGNPLLGERVADLQDIAAQVTATLAGEELSRRVELVEDTILLADELLPSELMSLPRQRVAGLATSGGGATSHMALIAASFGIPTLVAVGPGLSRVPEGARVLLDATASVLIIDPDEQAQARALVSAAQAAEASSLCVTRDGERITLLANLGGLEDVGQALAAGAEGCGLLRTEFLFLDRDQAPTEEEQQSAYQAVVDALGGRPITIRTLDIGGDKPVPYIHFPYEQNPALGARGIRTDLFRPELLDQQLRAIAAIKGEHVKVMVPMVSSVAELRSVRDRLKGLGKQARLGAMVETPAAALTADTLAAEADFLSIGSNDLAQYALAMDRTNPLLAASIDALHPAVLRLIAMTSEAGQRCGKPVSLCGNLASEPLGALLLIGLGIRELSGVPAALPAVRDAVAQVSASACREIASSALKLESAAQVRALAAELLNETRGETK